jgi:hypothetical protein
MNNFMNGSNNKYVEAAESIEDVAIECFKLIVNSNNGLFNELSL